MNKKFIIVFLFATIAVIAGALVPIVTKRPEKTLTPIIRYASSPPAITLVVDAPVGVSVSFVGERPFFPKTLPQYRFFRKIHSGEEIEEISKGLGFESPPKKLLFGKETVTGWTTPVSTLSYVTNGNNSSWSYALIQSTLTPQTVLTPSDVAKNFIEKHFFFDGTARLFLDKEMPSPIEHIQIKENPPSPVRGFLFTNKTPNSFNVVTDRFDPSFVSAVVDQTGVVRSVSFVAPPVVSQEQESSIISIDEAVASINKGLGLLVSVTKNNDSYWDKTPQFSSVSLLRVNIVYFPNQATSLLSPFYLFKGTATSTDGFVVDVSYAVSAIE